MTKSIRRYINILTLKKFRETGFFLKILHTLYIFVAVSVPRVDNSDQALKLERYLETEKIYIPEL